MNSEDKLLDLFRFAAKYLEFRDSFLCLVVNHLGRQAFKLSREPVVFVGASRIINHLHASRFPLFAELKFRFS